MSSEYMFFLVFFFFKQKTAYEMRISDWSSDVCSSDLPHAPAPFPEADANILLTMFEARAGPTAAAIPRSARRYAARRLRPRRGWSGGSGPSPAFRSEEHTSELQSLMRISYAVFCLKKKNR